MARGRKPTIFSLPMAAGGPPTSEELAACNACPLAGTRPVPMQVVGDGRLLIVGEAPGEMEERTGIPFVGQSGRLLRYWLEQAGITDYAITNAVRHRPPHNRTPADDEVAACAPYLAREIAAVRPRVVVLVGEVAMRYVWAARGRVKRHHGRWGDLNGIPAVGMIHPAAVLRMGEPQRSAWAASCLAILSQAWARAHGDREQVEWREAAAPMLPASPAVLAIDCETSGLDPRTADPILAAASDGERAWVYDAPRLPRVEGATLMHHSAFDGPVLARCGLLDARRVDLDDTMVLAHVLGHSDLTLKGLSARVLRQPMDTFEDRFGHIPDLAERVRQDRELWRQLAEYCALDARQTRRLFDALWQAASPDDRSVYLLVERPLLPVIVDMTVNGGFAVDREAMEAAIVSMEREIEEIKGLFAECAGEANLDSPAQLAAALERLGVPLVRRTPSGRPSTGEGALREIAHLHVAVQLILLYRERRKLLSTYLRPLAQEERVTALWHQVGTRTGRLSSSSRNLQNMPAAVKRYLTARPGRTLVRLDLSQIELRVAAHLSREPALLQAFRTGRDVHQETMDALGLPDRRLAKVFNFGLIYGAGPDKLVESARLYDISLSRQEAELFYRRMRERMAAYFAWAANMGRAALEGKTVRGLYGRRFRFPPPRDAQEAAHLERQACNYPIQGGAVDITKRLMSAAWRVLGRPILAQVHDEIVFEVAPDEVDDFVSALRRLLREENPLDVPLEADITWGFRWKE